MQGCQLSACSQANSVQGLVWQAGSGQRPLNDVCLAASDVAKKIARMLLALVLVKSKAAII